MGKKQNTIISVGDPVRLKVIRNLRPSHYTESPEELGIGTVVEKMTGLFLYPHEKNVILEYDSELDPNYISHKTSINKSKEQTSICKVFWYGINKEKWEYEKDLELLTSN